MDKDREWVVSDLEHVGWIDGRYFHTSGYRTSLVGSYRPATPTEISTAIDEIARRKKSADDRAKREQEILDMVGVGLTPDDFCRFRGVCEEDGEIVVSTRENGVGGFSGDAVKKAGDSLINRGNDDGDSTYAWYSFKKAVD